LYILVVTLNASLSFNWCTQMDINGDATGLLAAHPLAPLVSIHHLDVINPIFPNTRTQAAALAHLLEAGRLEQASLLQQSQSENVHLIDSF